MLKRFFGTVPGFQILNGFGLNIEKQDFFFSKCKRILYFLIDYITKPKFLRHLLDTMAVIFIERIRSINIVVKVLIFFCPNFLGIC